VNGDDSIMLQGHPGALSQIVTNLVMNSIMHAYQNDGHGHLRFDLMQRRDRIILTYSDNGCGIAPEHQSQIFDPFFTTARDQGGTGLGLYIVYNLVTQKLKGTIQCVSQPGAGTTFTLELPCQ
jgi:signal transduction histidine kinase